MFEERKAAQIAAYLLNKASGSMSHMKLVKLMYLADRQFYNDYGMSITEDKAVSMSYGPVLSKTLDLINGNVSYTQGWDELISAKANHEVELCRPITENDFDLIADEAEQVLDKIFNLFGGMDKWDLVKFTHTLKEWKDPGETSIPITTREIFEALGKPEEEIRIYLKHLKDEADIDSSPIEQSDFILKPPPYPTACSETLDAIFRAI